jgi:hypothetical protein
MKSMVSIYCRCEMFWWLTEEISEISKHKLFLYWLTASSLLILCCADLFGDGDLVWLPAEEPGSWPVCSKSRGFTSRFRVGCLS